MLNITRTVKNERVAQTRRVRGRVAQGNVCANGILGMRLSDWLIAAALEGWYASSFLMLKHQPACSANSQILPCRGRHLRAGYRDATRAHSARVPASLS